MTHILIVEDNLTLLENIAFELEMREYQVTQVNNGKAAVEFLRQSAEQPDIIVSDIAMPDMDGYELLEEVRATEAWQAIPFIFLTAFDSSNSMRISKGLGVDDYLVKPFDPEDLVAALENKLKRTQQIRTHTERGLDATRRELMSMITHELRTPLTIIHSSTALLEKSLANLSDEMTDQIMTFLRSGTARMNRLVNRIIFMVQIEGGHLTQAFQMSSKMHDLNTITKQVLQRFDDDAPAPDVEISVQLSDDPLPVRGVETYLKLMIDELIDNAVKFSAAGQTVTVTTIRDKDTVQLTVSDKGAGIPKDQGHKIWERFTQINREDQEQQGVGIGLSLVREIVETHGGQCEVQSEVGEGTTAVLTMPLMQGESV